jgi:hypothetical protein
VTSIEHPCGPATRCSDAAGWAERVACLACHPYMESFQLRLGSACAMQHAESALELGLDQLLPLGVYIRDQQPVQSAPSGEG